MSVISSASRKPPLFALVKKGNPHEELRKGGDQSGRTSGWTWTAEQEQHVRINSSRSRILPDPRVVPYLCRCLRVWAPTDTEKQIKTGRTGDIIRIGFASRMFWTLQRSTFSRNEERVKKYIKINALVCTTRVLWLYFVVVTGKIGLNICVYSLWNTHQYG